MRGLPHARNTARGAPSSWRASPRVCSSSAGLLSISSCSYREARLADMETNPPHGPLPDGVISEEEVTRTENRWIAIMLGMLGVMMAVIVATGASNALHPPSNVET